MTRIITSLSRRPTCLPRSSIDVVVDLLTGVMAVALALLTSSYKEIFSKKKAKNADQVGNRLNRVIVEMTPEDILDQVGETQKVDCAQLDG